MISSLSGHVDARRSHFHNIGRDQNNVYQTIHITIADLTPDRTCPCVQSIASKRPRNYDNVSRPADDDDDENDVSRLVHHKRPKLAPSILPHGKLDEVSQTSPQAGPAVQAHPETGSPHDAATGLVVAIIQLLVDRGETKDNYRILELELELLRQILTLTALAIQTFENTPLGQNLANSIDIEVAQICMVLQELFYKINSYREGLSSTSICAMWYQVWRKGREVDGLALLRMKLSDRQKSLCGFLVALNSYV
jgi:hypothetical protein